MSSGGSSKTSCHDEDVHNDDNADDADDDVDDGDGDGDGDCVGADTDYVDADADTVVIIGKGKMIWNSDNRNTTRCFFRNRHRMLPFCVFPRILFEATTNDPNLCIPNKPNRICILQRAYRLFLCCCLDSFMNARTGELRF